MDMPKLDGLICAAPKDYDLLPLAILQLRKHAPVNDIYVVTPDKYTPSTDMVDGLPIKCLTDEEALPFSIPEIAHHRKDGWFKQQFIKLLNVACGAEWYVVVDADTMLTKRYQPFAMGRRPLWLTNNRAHSEAQVAYRKFNEKMFGIEQNHSINFIGECCLYKTEYIEKMIAGAGVGNRQEFIHKVVDLVNGGDHGIPAESELYMGYVHYAMSGAYTYRPSRYIYRGKYDHLDHGSWSPLEVAILVAAEEEIGESDYATFHHWL